jgi:hypothetical protein
MAAGRGEASSLVDVVAYRNADALLHVVRAFRDAAVPHPKSSIDPARDARTVEEELILADLGGVERRLERLGKEIRKNPSAELKKEFELLGPARACLEAGRALRTLGLSTEDQRRLRGFQFLSSKPLLVVINLDEADAALAETSQPAELLGTYLQDSGAHAVAVCAKIELEIAQLDPADAQAFMADLRLSHSGLDRVIRAAYELLGYISFFTVGDDECRAWSIARGTSAQDAAGEIHSDIQRGFIRAEVVAYQSLIARGSMHASREHGEVRLEGKEHIVQDGDIINFRFAT